MRAHALNALFSLIFAALILGAVGQHRNTEEIFVVPIEINVPSNVIVSYQGRVSASSRLVLEEGNAFKVTLSGTREKLAALRQAGYKVFWSPSQKELSEALEKGKLELNADKLVSSGLPKRLEALRVEPSILELDFGQVVEDTAHVKQGEVIGGPAEGYRIKGFRLNVTQVTVRGDYRAIQSDPGTSDAPYLTEPIDLRTRPREDVVVKRNVLCRPQGVHALEQVEVTVVIEPAKERRKIEFPIHCVLDARHGANEIEALPFRVTAEGPNAWLRRLELLGPKTALDRLERVLQSLRNNVLVVGEVPFAYIRALEFAGTLNLPPEGESRKAKIRVTGLPDGVELTERDLDFRVRLMPSIK